MVQVQNVLESYSKLSAEDLKVEDPRTMVEILNTAFGEARYSDKGVYLFPDGSKSKFIKCCDCYEITRFGKLLARLGWRR